MTTAQAILPTEPAPIAAKPLPAPPDGLPWIFDEAPPPAPAAPRSAPPRPARDGGERARPEPLGWGAAVLTLLVAANIMFGTHGAHAPRPKALLPEVIEMPAR